MSQIEVRSAGLLVVDGKVLLVNHEKHGQSYWVLPGGHVRFGEPLSAAVVREMVEELAMDVTVGPLVIVHDYVSERRHVVNHVFRVEVANTAFRVKPEKTLKGARWVPLDELDDIALRPPIADHLRKTIDQPSGRTVYIGRA